MQPSSVGTTQRNISDAARPYFIGFQHTATRALALLTFKRAPRAVGRALHPALPSPCELPHTSSRPAPSRMDWSQKIWGHLMRKAIVGVAAFASLTVAGLISSIAATGINKEQSVREATVQMERLATKLEHAKKIASETKLGDRPAHPSSSVRLQASGLPHGT